MNKDEIVKVINRHMKQKDVGIAMLSCISEPNQIEMLALDLEQLALFSISNCKHENEKMHQGNGFVYVTCKDCGEDL